MTTTRPPGHVDQSDADARHAAAPPPLNPIELGRWAWRQLTSMRTALLLLFLLALAAIPGSVVPQENVNSITTSQWQQQHPHLTPIYQKLGLFSVYHSVWFSAIYLLLVISLVGCIVPRLGVYWRGLRAKPPAPPRNLVRLPESRSWAASTEDGLLDRAAKELRRRRYRVVRHDSAVSAERGYLREAGNLLFHLSVLIVLAGMAAGSLFGYQGGVIVVTGSGFSNSLSQYDDFRPGAFFTPGRLAPFSFAVHDFHVQFITSGREAGTAHEFSAALSYRTAPGAAARRTNISVNHPLKVDGTSVYLISHGYAPHITVRDGKGHVAFSGPVVFLPEDDTFRSFGVVKAPDGQDSAGRPEQVGLEGEFYPTYAFTNATGPFSAFPDDKNPAISMLAYTGDLGLDSGQPQSVYSLDKAHLKPIRDAKGKPVRIDLMLHQTQKLPNGMGSITFDGVSRYVKLQVDRAARDRSSGGDLAGEIAGLSAHLGAPATEPTPEPSGKEEQPT